jgi:hypothetical protein
VTEHRTPVAEGTSDPIGVLLLGSAVPAVLAGLLLALAAVPFGLNQVTSSLVGAGMAALALTVGPVLNRLCRNLDPAMVLGIAVLAYCLVILLLGLGFSLLNDTTWLDGQFAAVGVIVVSVAWAVGHMRAAKKLRQPLYQQDDATAGR